MEAAIEVAVEAAVQRLQWRQQHSGCSGGSSSAAVVGGDSNIAVVVETAFQWLWRRQRKAGRGLEAFCEWCVLSTR
jgi:hypothetical protein